MVSSALLAVSNLCPQEYVASDLNLLLTKRLAVFAATPVNSHDNIDPNIEVPKFRDRKPNEDYYEISVGSSFAAFKRESGQFRFFYMSHPPLSLDTAPTPDQLDAKARAAGSILLGLDSIRMWPAQLSGDSVPTYQVELFPILGGVPSDEALEIELEPDTGRLKVLTFREKLPSLPRSLTSALSRNQAQAIGMQGIFREFQVESLETVDGPHLFISKMRGWAPAPDAFRSQMTREESRSAAAGQGFLVYKMAFARSGTANPEFFASVSAIDGRTLLLTDLRNRDTLRGPVTPEPPKFVMGEIKALKSRYRTVELSKPLESSAKPARFSPDLSLLAVTEKGTVAMHADTRVGIARASGAFYRLPKGVLKKFVGP